MLESFGDEGGRQGPTQPRMASNFQSSCDYRHAASLETSFLTKTTAMVLNSGSHQVALVSYSFLAYEQGQTLPHASGVSRDFSRVYFHEILWTRMKTLCLHQTDINIFQDFSDQVTHQIPLSLRSLVWVRILPNQIREKSPTVISYCCLPSAKTLKVEFLYPDSSSPLT